MALCTIVVPSKFLILNSKGSSRTIHLLYSIQVKMLCWVCKRGYGWSIHHQERSKSSDFVALDQPILRWISLSTNYLNLAHVKVPCSSRELARLLCPNCMVGYQCSMGEWTPWCSSPTTTWRQASNWSVESNERKISWLLYSIWILIGWGLPWYISLILPTFTWEIFSLWRNEIFRYGKSKSFRWRFSKDINSLLIS